MKKIYMEPCTKLLLLMRNTTANSVPRSFTAFGTKTKSFRDT